MHPERGADVPMGFASAPRSGRIEPADAGAGLRHSFTIATFAESVPPGERFNRIEVII
jgi:hypothetical protein